MSFWSTLAVTTTTLQKGHVFSIPKRATNRTIARSSREFILHLKLHQRKINQYKWIHPQSLFLWHLKMGTPFKKEISIGNHHFLGAMLNFAKVTSVSTYPLWPSLMETFWSWGWREKRCLGRWKRTATKTEAPHVWIQWLCPIKYDIRWLCLNWATKTSPGSLTFHDADCLLSLIGNYPLCTLKYKVFYLCSCWETIPSHLIHTNPVAATFRPVAIRLVMYKR